MLSAANPGPAHVTAVPVLYPGADWHPLGAQTEPPMTGHHIVCVHTMAGYLTSTENWFRVGNGRGYRGAESHFGVGGKWGPDVKADRFLDGAVWQWQDLLRQADANLDGNPTVLSIETADNATHPIEPWTPAQAESIAKLLAWLTDVQTHRRCPSGWQCRAEGIPLVLVPDTRRHRRGVGYHRQGVDPWRASGGVRWSNSRGKTCPGSARITQLPDVLARARQITRGAAMPAAEEIALTVLNQRIAVSNDPAQPAPGIVRGETLARWLAGTVGNVRALLAGQAALLAAVEGQTGRLTAALGPALAEVSGGDIVDEAELAAQLIRQLSADAEATP